MTIKSINPATEEVMAEYPELTADQIDRALDESQKTYRKWRKTSFAERAKLMIDAAAYLRKNKERLATLATAEMGKPITEAEAEVEKCAWNCEFYAEMAPEFLAPRPAKTNATESYVAFEPIGTVLAVMPWNFPFWQVMRFAAPALMAGNAAVLKHASNIPQCALALEEVFRETGFPTGLFQTLLVPGSGVDKIIADNRIAAVTLTGSDDTGSKVAEASGRNLKKTVLELGGSDPFIILSDADIPAAAKVAARARNQNNGQSCIAAKRFIVVEDVADQFEEAFIAEVGALKVGDPMDRSTQVGPLARSDLRDDLTDQVDRTLAAGAKLAVGGHRPERKGWYYMPTVLTGVTPDMPAFREEIFGPVAAVIRARSTEDAIDLANDSEYGLGGALWTRDIEKGKQLARQIESGAVFINGMTASDPRLPFGGVKRSGYGRELADFGIREFVNIQTVWIGPAV
jgi:succinate-semialdehyde dehydrogenase/glutarate-semialdehyde dehydrogenase